MKNKFLAVCGGVALLFAACSKEDATGLVLQKHDDNRMMDSMHAVMSRMDNVCE